MVKRKLNLIALTNLISGALAIHSIRVIAELNSMIHWVEPDEV